VLKPNPVLRRGDREKSDSINLNHALGEGKYRDIDVLERADEPKIFVLEGRFDGQNKHSVMSASMELQICHYEAFTKSKTVRE
jgi:hypothetical protein